MPPEVALNSKVGGVVDIVEIAEKVREVGGRKVVGRW